MVIVSSGPFRTPVATITVFERVQRVVPQPKLDHFLGLRSQTGQTGDNRWIHRKHLRIRSAPVRCGGPQCTDHWDSGEYPEGFLHVEAGYIRFLPVRCPKGG